MTTGPLEQPLMSLKLNFTNVNDRADRALQLAVRNRFRSVSMLPTLRGLFSVGRQLDRLIAAFNSSEIDRIADNRVQQIANELVQINAELNRCVAIYTQAGLRRTFVYRSLLDRIEAGSSHLTSIVEGLHISANKDFVAEIASSAKELQSLNERADPRTLVGQM